MCRQVNMRKILETEYLKEKRVPKRLWPEYVEYIDQIPRTDSGKVQKFKLDKVLRERIGLSDNEKGITASSGQECGFED